MTESKRIKLSDAQIRVIIFLFILAVFVIIKDKICARSIEYIRANL